MQSVTIGLFDQQFIKTGIFKKEYGGAVHRIFSFKPKCSRDATPVSGEEVKLLEDLASAFIQDVETYLKK